MNAIRAFLCLPCLLFILGGEGRMWAAGEEYRSWTNQEGRQVEAAFGGVQNGVVSLKLRSGVVAPVPLDKLSSEDQEWVHQNGAKPALNPSPAGGLSPKSPGAPGKDWPKTVSLPDAPKATAVKEDAEAKEFTYRTEHFEFRSPARLGADVVREFGRMFEGTMEVNRQLPLGINPTPENGQEYFVAKLYLTMDDYLKDGGVKGSAGVYSGGARAVQVPLGSLGVKMVGKRYMVEQGKDSDTLIHEITHQMMNHWLGKLPEWYVEGSAMYVGSCVFHPSGTFTLPRLGQTVKKLQHIGPGKHLIWHLNYLMHITNQQWSAGFGNNPDGTVQRNYTSAIALTYFLYHGDDKGDGAHMISFMKDIADGKNKDDAQNEHIIRGRDYSVIEKEMTTFLRRGGITVEFVDGPVKSGTAAQ